MPDIFFIAACLLLFLSHAVPSWPGVREWLVGRLGRAGFGALHGLGSTLTLGLLIMAWRAQDDGRTLLFVPPDRAPLAVVMLVPLAFVLIALRLLCPPGDVTQPKPPVGVYRLTAAPGALGTLWWAALHLLATGDALRLTLFATLAAIAVFSLIRNRVAMGRADTAAADDFLRQTAIFPGWALLRRRQRWVWAEWRAVRPLAAIALGLAVWVAMLLLHPWLFGVDPLGLALMSISFAG